MIGKMISIRRGGGGGGGGDVDNGNVKGCMLGSAFLSSRAFLCRTGHFCVESWISLSKWAFLCRTSVIISGNPYWQAWMEMGMYELISHHQYGCQLKHNYIHYIEDDIRHCKPQGQPGQTKFTKPWSIMGYIMMTWQKLCFHHYNPIVKGIHRSPMAPLCFLYCYSKQVSETTIGLQVHYLIQNGTLTRMTAMARFVLTSF